MANTMFMRADEVAQELGVSKAFAYQLMRNLNEELKEKLSVKSESDEKTINVHISKLRSRYENNPDFSIETVRGIGYKAVLK